MIAHPLIGETILRTFIYGHITLTAKCLQSDTTITDRNFEGLSIGFGLRYTVGSGSFLLPGTWQGNEDSGGWLQWGNMHMTSLVNTGVQGINRWAATFSIPRGGIGDSHAKRGPATTDWAALWYCFQIIPEFTNFNADNADFLGIAGGVITTGTLIETAA